MNITIVIPTYNSGAFIEANMDVVMGNLPGDIKEVLIVDDGSNDSTWSILKKLTSAYPRIRLIRLTRNYGQAKATITGVNQARFNHIITFDDDLQYDISEASRLIQIAKKESDYQIVFSYSRKKRYSPSYNIFIRTAMWMLRNIFIRNLKKIKGINSFAIIQRSEFGPSGFHSIYVWELKSSGIFNVEVTHNKTRNRPSNYTVGKYINHFLPLIVFVASRFFMILCLLAVIPCIFMFRTPCIILSLVLFLVLGVVQKLLLSKLKQPTVNINEIYPKVSE